MQWRCLVLNRPDASDPAGILFFAFQRATTIIFAFQSTVAIR